MCPNLYLPWWALKREGVRGVSFKADFINFIPTPMSRYNTNPIELARTLRKNSTPAEKLLWSKLRNRKLLGFKFLRQHVIYYDIGVKGEENILFLIFIQLKQN